MSGAPAILNNLGVNAFSVIADSQPKLPVAILDRHFDPRRLCMAECIAQSFATDTVGFVVYNWRRFTRGPLLRDVQCGAGAAGLNGCKFVSKRAERFCQFAIRSLCHHVHVRLGGQDQNQPLAEHRMVVDGEDAD